MNHQEIETKLKNFSQLLEQIKDIDDKRKQLWLEIYNNAIVDRQNAYGMFSKLVVISADNSTEHAVHGKTMATYIEKMSRANDQLIKLAELVEKSLEKNDDDQLDENKLYELMSAGKK